MKRFLFGILVLVAGLAMARPAHACGAVGFSTCYAPVSYAVVVAAPVVQVQYVAPVVQLQYAAPVVQVQYVALAPMPVYANYGFANYGFASYGCNTFGYQRAGVGFHHGPAAGVRRGR